MLYLPKAHRVQRVLYSNNKNKHSRASKEALGVFLKRGQNCMKVIIFEGPRGSGKSSLIEDARHYLTKKGLKVECYFLPGTTDATKQMRQLALKDSTVSMLSRRFLQIAAGLDDHLNIENIVSQSEADYVLFDRSSLISNFIYGVMAGSSEDEVNIAKQAGRLYNDVNSKIPDLHHIFVYADTELCLQRIHSRNKEKDYLDLEMDEERERTYNDAYLGLFITLNNEALNHYEKRLHSNAKHPDWCNMILNYSVSELKDIVTNYGMDIDFYQKNSIFLLNSSTRKRALNDFLFYIGEN